MIEGGKPQKSKSGTVGKELSSETKRGQTRTSKKGGSMASKEELQKSYTPIFKEVIAATNKITNNFEKSIQSYEDDKDRYYQRKEDTQIFMDNWKGSLIDQLNVHVDPDFSKARTYGEAVNMIIYYTYISRVKMIFKHWKKWLKWANTVRRINAGALLVRVSRGMLARKEVFTIRENIRLQKEAEELEAKRRYVFANYMSRRISRRYKKYKRRCLFLWNLKRKEAATLIQKRVRIILAKLRVIRIIEWNALCYYSSTKIQVRWRMVLAKRNLILKRKIEYVRQWELSLQEKKFLQQLHYQHHGACLTLSRAYRAHTIHKRLQTILYWNRYNMAMIMQRVYRGHRARCRCAMLRADIVRMRKLREDSAVRIQAWCRRHLAKKIYEAKLEKKAHKAKKRKKRKKKKLKDKVIPLGGVFKLNLSSWNRAIRKTIRSNIPFRYVFERRKAIIIQRYYRGFHARRRCMLLRIKKKMYDIYGVHRNKVKAAIKIQKVYRGHMRRRVMRKELWRRMSIKIQCYWRRRAARRVVFRIHQKRAALAILNERLSALLLGKKVRERYLIERKYRRNILIIQRLIRKYLGRKYFRELKDLARFRYDSQSSAELTSMKVMSAVEIMILKESMERDIMVKNTTASGLKCPCLGPIQALYLFACGKKARYDPSQLASNRLDTTNLTKFLGKIDMITHSEKKEKPRKAKPPAETTMVLLKALKLGLVKIPPIVSKLRATDIDVLFNRHKDPAGGNVLQYLEFSDLLRGCGGYNNERGVLQQIPYETSYYVSFRERISLYGRYYDELSMDSASRCATSRTTASGENRSEQSSRKGQRIASREGKSVTPSQPSFRDLFNDGTTNESGLRKHYLGVDKALDAYLFHIDNLICNRETVGISVALIMFMALEHEKFAEPVFKWISAESYARVSSFVVPIQCLIRKRLATVAVRRRRIQRNIESEEAKTMRSIRLCQGAIRRRLQWQRIVKIAQKVMVKYIPHKGKPYWFNPRTRVTSFEKPRILGSYDCLEVPLPGPNFEYVIKCGTCEVNDADVNCDQCEDSMCMSCFATMHCKGKRLTHTYSPIPHCSLCKYQNATKSCVTCSLRKPKKGSLMSLVDGDRGVLCDTCYTYIHDGCNSTASVVTAKIGNETNFGENCKDAYLIQLDVTQRLDTDHRYSALVQFCEECQWRAATYRCSDCDQVYCAKCLMGYHSIGGPFASHIAEKIPYYTPDMHKKFERAMFAQRLQRRIEKVAQQYAKAALKKKIQSVIKVQSWWRMKMYGIPGKARLQEERLKERRMFKIRRVENESHRNKWSYKIRDVFGLAPELQSDTLEEKILKRHSVFRREKIRHFIYPNCADWGFLQQKSLGLDPPIEPTRKGSPRKGFNFGTLEELRDQAKYGGYRICGRINMKMGERQHDVNMDLSKFIKRGMLLRVGTAFFGVTNFTDKTLTLNRRWRFPSKNDCIIYRLPCLKNDNYKTEYHIRMKLFDYITGNPLSQGCLKGYRALYEFMSEKAKQRATEEKKAGFMAQNRKWNMIADARAVKGGWAHNLIFDDGGPADLSNPDGDQEVNPYRSARAKRCVPASERVPGEEWEANKEEIAARDAREAKMDDATLALEGDDWEEKIDPMSNRPYWVHKETKEYMSQMPRAVRAARDDKKKKAQLRKQFAEQQKKIARMKKK